MFMTGQKMLELLGKMTPGQLAMEFVVQDRDTGTLYALHGDIEPVVADEGCELQDEDAEGKEPNCLKLRAY